uniref:Macaca fascicularis brain cDNA clone: QmoA-10854, similar to human O-acyltransferase (membrane bound) domain containing 1(OACT1), mRNA, RefSeq: XM_371801.2 n=1 Tax=Macaca fascicularis TaxID=9541 RepID=I7G8A4_MACFA|nr:unnamed protein product [Macaca fascicularis]
MKWRGRACSEPRSRHCTPTWATERDSVSKEKKSLTFYFQNSRLYLVTEFFWAQNQTF